MMFPLHWHHAFGAIIVACCVLLSALPCWHAEWLDLMPAARPSDDAFHMHIEDDLLLGGTFALETGEAPHIDHQNSHQQHHHQHRPQQIIHNRVGLAMAVLPKPLAEASTTTTPSTPAVTPIRYEDLEHLVGQGFEENLEKFYQQHKHSLDESTRRSDVFDRPQNGTTTKPPRTYYLPGTEDPWSIYDKPPRPPQNEPSTAGIKILVAATTERQIAQIATTIAQLPSSSSPPKSHKKRIVKLVPVRLVPMAGESQKASSIGFPGFMAFLRNIQDSMLMSTTHSIQDKMHLLADFRDRMLRQIKKNIRSLWPTTGRQPNPPPRPAAEDISDEEEDKPMPRSKRQATPRSSDSSTAWSSGGNGMDFPSSEGALMSISFLTFAVFLIKLVLQVINTIKSKHYSYSTGVSTGVGTMTALNVIKKNRNARRLSVQDEDAAATMMPDGRLSVAEIRKAVEQLKSYK